MEMKEIVLLECLSSFPSLYSPFFFSIFLSDKTCEISKSLCYLVVKKYL